MKPSHAPASRVLEEVPARTTLSVIGLGKLGACTAACLAARGFDVIGVDINEDSVRAVNRGEMPVHEPQLQEFITTAGPRLRATTQYADAIEASGITFVIVPTPVQPDGQFSDKYLAEALTHLAHAFRRTRKRYHLFVITSTVSPGTTDERLIPLIERVSGKALGRDFGVCYNPEFIALGSVIRDFLNPDMVLIGESDRRAGSELASIYRHVCQNEPLIARMSVVSAEITKISLNAYVTMKISFANTLASICEAIPGADLDRITEALGADRRISPHTLKGGLPFGGPCFPRDNRAFAAFAGRLGVDAELAKASDEMNGDRAERVADFVLHQLSAGSRQSVSILGLAYKANTPVVEESPAIQIIQRLLKKRAGITVYDPLALDGARAVFGDRISYARSVKECVAGSAVCVITTQAEEFRCIDQSYFSDTPAVVVDCWRILDSSKLGPCVKYIPMGMVPSPSAGGRTSPGPRTHLDSLQNPGGGVRVARRMAR
ncbi:MAG TPA: nucleotide sugar dehydrogenase [bacterium]|nr:nucleotide sugar dehydrogenase [bacterium]